ncbi:MAG: NAD(P)-dependent oxidoreductase [Lachnospiraceae bacterium]|jgi:nucleoside-diphosphate-sugar epimerase|nr:NAD(P)-dependent oxidoreductase [Lachnospiraceae bacterium]
MRVVVTGATSFIGGVTVGRLLREGHEVYGIVRPGSRNMKKLWDHVSGAQQERLTVAQVAMEEIGKIKDQISLPADAWIHTSWEGSGSHNRTLRDVQQANVANSLEAVETAAEMGCKRFLFTGSQAEYGICHKQITEDMPCHPLSEYGKAKVDFGLQAEKLCRALNMEYIHTRIFSIYGPGDHPWTLVQSCLRTWLQGEEIKLGECTQWWNFLYIKDAASALTHLLTEGKAGYYNVAGSDTRRLKAFVQEMYSLCGFRGSYICGERPDNAEGPADLLPDIRKICGETGWRPETPFAEGIYETLHCLSESASG